jgi:hypothetical protein
VRRHLRKISGPAPKPSLTEGQRPIEANRNRRSPTMRASRCPVMNLFASEAPAPLTAVNRQANAIIPGWSRPSPSSPARSSLPCIAKVPSRGRTTARLDLEGDRVTVLLELVADVSSCVR